MCDLAINYVYIAIVFASIGFPVSIGQQWRCENNKSLSNNAQWRCTDTVKCKLAKTIPLQNRTVCGTFKMCCPEPLPRTAIPAPIRGSSSNMTTPSQAEIAKANKIALEKCYEYKNYIYKNYTMRGELLDMPDKYVSELDCQESVETLVSIGSGGEDVLPKEYPYMALLGFEEKVENPRGWRCGGSLISEQFILSAAHCTKIGVNTEVKWALLGKLERMNITRALTGTNLFRIIQRFNHPNYKKGGSNSEYNDIALYKLEKPVRLSTSIRPICLYHDKQPLASVGAKVAVSGWGVKKAGEQPAKLLQKSIIRIVDPQKCVDLFKTDPGLLEGYDPTTMICAGDLRSDADSCPGDSGGPMLTLLWTMQCMYLQLGVVSRGLWDCGHSEPAIYTNVSYYLPWIQSVVWPTK